MAAYHRYTCIQYSNRPPKVVSWTMICKIWISMYCNRKYVIKCGTSSRGNALKGGWIDESSACYFDHRWVRVCCCADLCQVQFHQEGRALTKILYKLPSGKLNSFAAQKWRSKVHLFGVWSSWSWSQRQWWCQNTKHFIKYRYEKHVWNENNMVKFCREYSI